jgi:hypothetical protein
MPAPTRLDVLRQGLVAAALAAVAAGCSSDALLKTKQDSELMVLTPTYAVERNLGKGPVAVDLDDENLSRFEIARKGLSPQFALVLFPDKVSGTIELDLADEAGGSATAAASDLSRYFDQVLRAHRLLLRADLDGARRLLDHIEATYDAGYATLVLRGTLALLDGDSDQARRHFRDAKALLPDRNDIGTAFLDAAGGTKQ